MFRRWILIPMTLVVLAIGLTSATAASYATIHTKTSFGLLFVLAADHHGNLYVADQANDVILKLSPSGRLLLKDPMPASCGISGLAASGAGAVYAVANCQRVNVVYHFSRSGRLLQRFGRQPPGPGGVAVDRRGHVYVAYGFPPGQRLAPPRGVRIRPFTNRFVEFTSNGAVLRTVNLPGTPFPWGIAVDGHGNVYLTAANGLVKVSPAGHILRRWRRILPPLGRFLLLAQPAVDTHGNVYAPDRPGNILKISATGRVLGVFVRHGRGPRAIQQPVGLAVTHGHLFAGEAGPDRIKEFSLSGRLLAIWTP